MTSGIGKNILITGSNRGIGFGLVKELVKHSEVDHIFAGCRNPSEATDLKALQDKNSAIKIVQLDVENDASIKSAFDEVKNVLGSDGKLNLLINNAGILEYDGVSTQNPDRNVLLRHLNVNTVGMVMTFIPLLHNAVNAKELARIINVSSDSGSCTYIKGSGISFGNIGYSMSKTAINSYSRILAGDEPNLVVIALDPSWVQTDMGGSSAPYTVPQASHAIVKLISKLTPSDSGSFLNKDGVVPF